MTRQETLLDHLATIIQRGHVAQKTSHEVATEIMDALEAEAEMWREQPMPGREP